MSNIAIKVSNSKRKREIFTYFQEKTTNFRRIYTITVTSNGEPAKLSDISKKTLLKLWKLSKGV